MSKLFAAFIVGLGLTPPSGFADELAAEEAPANADLEAEEFGGLEIEELMNIKVTTVVKKPEKVSDSPATVMVITARQIEERGYEYLDQALRDLPGVDLVHVHGEWPTIFVLRGMSGDENKRTLLMIDGIVENNLFEGSILGGPQYSLHNVERIEVIWGPVSALYGANAFGGIIHIFTKKGKDAQGAEFASGVGSFRTRFHKARLGGEAHGVEFHFSASVYDSDGPVFKERHPRYSNSFVKNAYSLVGRFAWKGYEVGFSRFDRPMGEGLFSNSPTKVAYGLPLYGFKNSEGQADELVAAVPVNGDMPSLWHSFTSTVYAKKEFPLAETVKLRTKLYWRNTGIAPDSREYYWKVSENRFYDSRWASDSWQLGAETQIDYAPSGSFDMSGGAQFERNIVEKNYRSVVDTSGINSTDPDLPSREDSAFVQYRNLAGFAQGRYRPQLLKFISFILGGRFDYNNEYGNTWNPRAGVVVRPLGTLAVRTVVGTAYRAPTNQERFSTTNIRIANPGLRPETLKTFEAGANFSLFKRILIDASFFVNVLNDIIIQGVALPGSLMVQNQNRGSARVRGSQISIDTALLHNLSSFANVTVQDARKNEGTGRGEVAIANIARYKANAGLNYGIEKWVNVNVTGNWVGRRTVAVTNPIGSVGGYFILNTVLASRLYWEDLKGSIAVENLLNRTYFDPGHRAANGIYYSTRLPQPGRSFFFKISYALQDAEARR